LGAPTLLTQTKMDAMDLTFKIARKHNLQQKPKRKKTHTSKKIA